MADNVTLNSGTGGATLATDEVGTDHYQRVKLTDGTADSSTVIEAGGGLEATALRVTIASDSTGVVSVDDNGGSLTVDGTVTANLSATDNAVLDSIDTAVNGTITVDLGANNDIQGVETENAAVAGNPVLVGARYDLTPRTLGDGDAGALAVDVNGHLITSPHADDVALSDNISNTITVETDHAGGYVAKAVFPFMFDGSTWDRVRGDSTNGLLVNLGANNDITGTVTANLSATDNAVLDNIDTSLNNIEAAVSGSEMQVDVVAALPAGTNVVGDVGISGARTSGGTTLYKNIDVDESEDQVKATAGQVYWIHAINLGTTPRYLKIYNATAATVVVGTTVPDLTFPIPSQGDANGAGFTLSIPNGIAFSTAITIAATTGVADADSGAPGANEVICNLGYA